MEFLIVIGIAIIMASPTITLSCRSSVIVVIVVFILTFCRFGNTLGIKTNRLAMLIRNDINVNVDDKHDETRDEED